MNYEESLQYLYSLGNEVLTAKLGLENIEVLLRHLGDPHREYPSILIAGTNGKGSVAAFSESMLRRAGWKTGLYTSPHLVRIEERIRVHGEMIPAGEFACLAGRVKQAIGELLSGPLPASGLHLDRHPTFFEVVTAIAFLYFAQQKIDCAVLEVGMGGKFDATNVVNPVVSVITNVDFDHQAYLGKRLEQIAGEKAGIIKPRPDGSPGCVITAADNEVVLGILRDRCQETRAQLIRIQDHFPAEVFSDSSGRFSVGSVLPGGPRVRLQIPLPGRHQVLNALTALGAVSQLEKWGICVTPLQMEEGIASTRWPGRLEWAGRSPQLILDGAHNPAGATVLAEFLRDYCQKEKTLLLFGVMQDKEFRAMGMTLFPLARQILLTRAAWSRAASPEDIRKALPEFAEKILVFQQLEQALQSAWKMALPEDTIVLAGSLFLVGEAREILTQKGMLVSP